MTDLKLSEALGDKKIFTRMMTAHILPWSEDTDITGELLDFEYMFNQSGDKIISPAVEKSISDDELGTTEFNKLVDVAYMMYNKRWSRLWEILTAEFNPLQNYDMSESKTINYGKIDTNSGTDTTLRTGTDTHAESGTDTMLMTGTDTNAESGTNTILMTGTDTHAESGKDTIRNTGTDNIVKTGSEALVRTGSNTLTKSGSETDSHTGGYTDTNNNLSTEHEVSAFNSSGYQDASKDTTTGSAQRTYNSDNVTKTFNNRTDTSTNNNLTDTTTFNSVTTGETKNLQDETTYGHQDQETRNMSDATTFGHQNLETRNMTDAKTFGHTDTETRNMTDALTHGHVQTASGRDTETLTRSGNIGVTTSQQMAQSSLDLWKWNFFYDIFRDIDSIFTITTY